MRMHNLIRLLAGVVVLLAGCAPVDEPAPRGAGLQPAAQPGQVANLPHAPPADVPKGLRDRIEAALDNVRSRDLLTSHSFWTVFHGILGIGPETRLTDPLTGQKVNAIDYIANGGEVRGLAFLPTAHGLDVRTGPQFVGQGHQDQYVAEMTQWGMPMEQRFLVHGKEYVFADFVQHTKMRASVTKNQELEWAVLVIGQHRGTELRWTNSFGEEISVEDMLRYEMKKPVDTGACGGTHRLFGITWVYYLHLRRGGKSEGVWKEVAAYLEEQKGRARKYQNPDGSFSTKYLAGPDNGRDMQQRIGTTGHVLEWLALYLPDEELKATWVQEAANALALLILDIRGSAMEGGALYHATHGLSIYHSRVFDSDKYGRQKQIVPLPPGSN